MNFDDIEIAIKHEFLSEAKELLEALEADLIAYEQNPEEQGHIDQIFRIAHTLKGSSLAAGFDEFGNFANKVENVLSLLREMKITITPELMDVLLKSNDLFNQYVEILNDDFNSILDTSELEAKLESFLGEKATLKIGGKEKPTEKLSSMSKSTIVPVKKIQDDKLTSIEDVLASSKTTILVCDDEEDIVEIICEMLDAEGFNTIGANSGDESLKILKESKINAIVTDLKMPKMDGIEFISSVRSYDKNMPVVFCSGYAKRDDIKKFLELGAYSFIEKPIDENRLIVTIKNAVQFNRTRDLIVALSSLNFKAYIAMNSLINQIERQLNTNLDSKLKSRDELADHMDNISKLTNYILKS